MNAGVYQCICFTESWKEEEMLMLADLRIITGNDEQASHEGQPHSK